jgi:hypothetical protein
MKTFKRYLLENSDESTRHVSDDDYLVKDGAYLTIGTVYYTDENGHLHRENGPAVEYTDYSKQWFLHGKRHRENGPAIEALNAKHWYFHGEKHRLDGPADTYSNGTKY